MLALEIALLVASIVGAFWASGRRNQRGSRRPDPLQTALLNVVLVFFVEATIWFAIVLGSRFYTATTHHPVLSLWPVYWPLALLVLVAVLVASTWEFKERWIFAVVGLVLGAWLLTVLVPRAVNLVSYMTHSDTPVVAAQSWQGFRDHPDLAKLTCIQHGTSVSPQQVQQYAGIADNGTYDLRFALVVGYPKLSDQAVLDKLAKAGVKDTAGMKVRHVTTITVYSWSGCKANVVRHLVTVSLAIPANASGSKVYPNKGVLPQGPWKKRS